MPADDPYARVVRPPLAIDPSQRRTDPALPVRVDTAAAIAQ